jgi:sterol desaturase/sphingolipid hydroxylase (fatty acid hydroxylase superfamily)
LLGVATATLSYCTGVAMHPLFLTVAYCWLVIIEVVDKFQHSHVSTSLGPLNYFVPLGDMHQIHHSAELKHRDKNFGNVSLLFDWMFGTLYIPQPGETVRLGLNDQELGAQNPHKRLIDIYTEPFAYAWRALKRKNSAEDDQLALTSGPLS